MARFSCVLLVVVGCSGSEPTVAEPNNHDVLVADADNVEDIAPREVDVQVVEDGTSTSDSTEPDTAVLADAQSLDMNSPVSDTSVPEDDGSSIGDVLADTQQGGDVVDESDASEADVFGSDVVSPPKPEPCQSGRTVTTCDIRLGLQGKISEADYSSYGLQGDAIFVHGYALGAPAANTSGGADPPTAKANMYNKFWSGSEESVAALLNTYCANVVGASCDSAGQNCCASIEGTVVLDIEHPYNLSRLGGFGVEEQELGLPTHTLEELAQAVNLRVSVASAAFPNAQIALYGLFTISGQANLNSMQVHIDAAKSVVAGGLLEGVDIVLPVAYPRFGPLDAKYSKSYAMDYSNVTIDATKLVLAAAE